MSELNYVEYNFDELVTQLTNRLKERGAWKDTYRSSTGSMLIELFAAVANLMLYYVERRAEESYIGTAKNKSSIINLVRLLNYSPKRKTSATGILRFTLTDGVHTSQIFIPKYTQCTASNGKKFLTNEDAAIMIGQTYVDVNAIQGERISVGYSSTGTVDQEYKIEDTSIENSNLDVSVAGVSWTKVTSFIDSISTSNHYILRQELDDTVTVIFGDGVFGKSPSVGENILVEYVKSDGLDGNIYELGRITTLVSTIIDIEEVAIETTVTNTTVFLGGDDVESIEEIRSEAPKVFATGDKAVTRSDFISILNNYTGIADSNAWGENEETPPNVSMYNQVKLCIILQSWALPSTSFKTTLEEYLYDEKALMTVRYSWVDPEIIEVVPTMTLKVIKGRSLSYVQSLVTTAMESQFELGVGTKLGLNKRLSDIIVATEAVSGISYSYVVLKIRKDLTTTYTSDILEGFPIKPGSVEVYINDVLVAVDDESNGFIDQTTDYIIGSTYNVIDYITGEIVLDMVPAISGTDTLHVLYQQETNGDIEVNQNQICKLYEVDITSIAYE